MKKIIIILIVFSILISARLIAGNRIEVSRMSEDFIQLQIHIEDYTLEDVSVNGSPFQTINLTNLDYKKWNDTGSIQVPFISKLIGLPENGNFSASISNKNFVYIQDIDLLYNPQLNGDTGIITPDYSKVPECYNLNTYFPSSILKDEIMGFIGNRYFGSLKIFPVQYNPVERRVKLFTELTINIHIHGDTKKSHRISSPSYIDNIADKLVLNNRFSKMWRKEREQSQQSWIPRNEDEINSFKFYIDKKGIYKISYSYFKDTIAFWQDSLGEDYDFNFDLDEINPRYLSLYHKDNPVPIYLYGEDDFSFDEGDYLEFFADINHGEDCFYDFYSLENCFILKYNEGEYGARLAVEDCGLYETDPRKYDKSYFFDTNLHFEEQQTFAFFSTVADTPEDLWMWKTLTAPSLNYVNLTIPDPYQMNIEKYKAAIKISLFGNTISGPDNSGAHHALAYINNSLIGETGEDWIGQEREIILDSLANENLQNGENTLYLSLPGDTDANLDEIFLDYIDVTYWREYLADDNYLEFNRPQGLFYHPLFQFEVNEFDTAGIDVYKIGVSKLENVSIESTMPEGGPPFLLTFQDVVENNETKYVALSQDQKLLPKEVVPNFPSNLHDEFNQADYLLISSREFLREDNS